jgi:hypothetical protein
VGRSWDEHAAIVRKHAVLDATLAQMESDGLAAEKQPS